MTVAQVVLAVAIAAAPASSPTAVLTLRQHSPAHRVPLVELYTSEGCSSCPPAERWLAEVAGNPARFDQLVALAFHVTAWDHIGWRDRYARPAHDDRLERYSRASGSGSLYTPAIRIDGREERGAREGLGQKLARLASEPAVADIALEVDWDVAARILAIRAEASPRPGQSWPVGGVEVTVAVFERDLVTEVRRGENQDRRLGHDFVVRALPAPGRSEGSKEVCEARARVPVPGNWKAADLGVAAFVHAAGTLEVLQATAVDLAPPDGRSATPP